MSLFCSCSILSTKLSEGVLYISPRKDCLLLEFCFSFDCTKDVNWWCHDKKPSPFMDWMATITARTELLLLNPLWILDDGQCPPPPPPCSCVCGGFFLYIYLFLWWLQSGQCSSARGFQSHRSPFSLPPVVRCVKTSTNKIHNLACTTNTEAAPSMMTNF